MRLLIILCSSRQIQTRSRHKASARYYVYGQIIVFPGVRVRAGEGHEQKRQFTPMKEKEPLLRALPLVFLIIEGKIVPLLN